MSSLRGINKRKVALEILEAIRSPAVNVPATP
jgi:hypothetical protein